MFPVGHKTPKTFQTVGTDHKIGFTDGFIVHQLKLGNTERKLSLKEKITDSSEKGLKSILHSMLQENILIFIQSTNTLLRNYT